MMNKNKFLNSFSSEILKIFTNIRILIIKYYYKNINNLKNKYCFIFLYLFKIIGKEIPADVEPIINFSFSILILSIIVLVSFINLMGYFISIYLINKYDIENRFPKYKKIIKFYEKTKTYIIINEIIICFLGLVAIIMLSLMVTGIIIFFT